MANEVTVRRLNPYPGGLRAVLRTHTRNLHEVKLRAATVAASVMVQLCPVSDKSGPGYQHMVETIAVRTGGLAGAAVYVEVKKPYAKFVNNGTVHMAPRPFFTVGLQQGAAYLRQALRRMASSEGRLGY